ncbi:MAG: DNA primase [Chloroflexota bacterium]
MSVTEEIKARLDVVTFLSQYINLKKAGRNYTGLCPFHSEKTPSFVVFPDSQNWRCFGACGEGGDIFTFLMKHEGLDFAAALKVLAEQAGVQLQERSADQLNRDEHLDKLRGLLDETTRFFHEKFVNSLEAAHARSYARKRGLTDQTFIDFRMGYAPNDWRQALDHLTQLGYTEDEIVEAGVAIRNEEKNSLYDRFRNRLVIPICDGRGQVIGFGARTLNPDDNPKYLNSPQTALFDKGATLFGLDKARRTIREGETAVIVEGYMDAIQAHQAGFTNVVAQMGTALTEAQLKQLGRYARRLILALDPDSAGVKATMRGLNVAMQTLGDSSLVFDPKGILRQAGKLNIEIMVVTLPEDQDPDDLIRDNPDGWRELVESAQPVVDYVIEAGTTSLTVKSTYTDREQIARDLLPILLATENDLQTNYNIQRLALKLRLDERMLIQWAQQNRRTTRTKGIANGNSNDGNNSQKPALQVLPAQDTTQILSPNREGAVQPEPLFDRERHCLATLIRNTNLLSSANRRLREVATKVPAAQEALGPLSAEDFVRSDFGVILEVWANALDQDDREPMDYLEQNLPYELCVEVERLLVTPLEAFKQRLNPAMHAELEAARRKRDASRLPSAQSEEEFLQRVLEQQVLELRKLRLGRENLELQFLQQDADPQMEMEYARRVSINRQAIRFIDQAVSQITHSQRAY